MLFRSVASRRGVGSGSLNIYASEREQGTPALPGPLRSVSACHIEINFPSTVSRRCFSATCRFSGKPSELPRHFPRRRIFVLLIQISLLPANPRPPNPPAPPPATDAQISPQCIVPLNSIDLRLFLRIQSLSPSTKCFAQHIHVHRETHARQSMDRVHASFADCHAPPTQPSCTPAQATSGRPAHLHRSAPVAPTVVAPHGCRPMCTVEYRSPG